MPLRLIEIILPQQEETAIKELIVGEAIIGFWREESSDTGLLIKVLLSAEETEAFLDRLESRFTSVEGFRVIMLPVEATLPRYEKKEDPPPEQLPPGEESETTKTTLRVSREELFSEINDSTQFSVIFAAMVVLSAIVAAIGLLRDNVTVVIGAMVIAPLLGPNVGLAFATTLGDFTLGRTALKTNSFGVLIALGISIAIGYILGVNPESGEIAARTEVHLSDIALALASGSAGVLAFTSGMSTVLIGVMVAVALLPPLVTFGLLLGSGNFSLAVGALLLLLTNLICVNLAGVATFLIQGVAPRTWWKANQAKKATRFAIAMWSALLTLLAIIIYFSQNR